MRKRTVVTDCNHTFKTGYTADDLAGCTIDCPVCTMLLIFPWETTKSVYTVVRARDFHRYLHDRDVKTGNEFVWPANAAGTSYVEF
jgi:hypothetical protein